MKNLLPEFKPAKSTGATSRFNSSVERIRAAPRNRKIADKYLTLSDSSYSLSKTPVTRSAGSGILKDSRCTKEVSATCSSHYGSTNPSPLLEAFEKKRKKKSVKILEHSEDGDRYSFEASHRPYISPFRKTRIINVSEDTVDIFQSLDSKVHAISINPGEGLHPDEEKGLNWFFLCRKRTTKTPNTECEPSKLDHMYSIDDSKPVSIEFRNHGPSSVVKVFWLDYQGEKVLRRMLKPGEKYCEASFSSHPWMLQDEESNCQVAFIAGRLVAAARETLSIVWNPLNNGVSLQTMYTGNVKSNLVISMFPS